MESNFNKLGKKTSDVINSLELNDLYFWEAEKGFLDIKRIILKREKR